MGKLRKASNRRSPTSLPRTRARNRRLSGPSEQPSVLLQLPVRLAQKRSHQVSRTEKEASPLQSVRRSNRLSRATKPPATPEAEGEGHCEQSVRRSHRISQRFGISPGNGDTDSISGSGKGLGTRRRLLRQLEHDTEIRSAKRRRRCSTVAERRQVAQDNFAEIMKGARAIATDPSSCVLLCMVRHISPSGVRRIMTSIDDEKGGPGVSKGYSSAGGLPVVVTIPEEYLHMVTEYFIQFEGLSREAAEVKITSKETWLGVVDGGHRHQSLIELGKTKPWKYAGYRWNVLLIFWQPFSILKAFARARNEFQRKEHIVDFTIYDVLVNLKEIADKLALRSGEVAILNRNKSPRQGFLREVADEYCGGQSFANDTLRILAGQAIRISRDVIECMGDILNREEPKLARSLSLAKSKKASIKLLDDRVYRKIITTQTLRGVKTFLEASSDEDRKNALYRLKFIAQARGCFKGMTKDDVDTQTKKAILARCEIEKFEEVMGTNVWPQPLQGIRNNILRTTKFDEVVEAIGGNGRMIISDLEKLYVRVGGIEAKSRLALFVNGPSERAENTQIDALPSPLPPTEPEGIDQSSPRSNHGLSPLSNATVSQEGDACHNAELQTSLDRSLPSKPISEHVTKPRNISSNSIVALPSLEEDALSKCNLNVYDMGWKEFERNVLTEQGVFDFIIGEPCPLISGQPATIIDEKEMNDYVKFIRRSLVPGSYTFLYVCFSSYEKWESMFKLNEMEVMRNPFYIVKDTGKVQKTVSTAWPQNAVESGIVARAPGKHPAGFKLDLKSSYTHIPRCSHKRKFAIIDHVPLPTRKLTFNFGKQVVRPGEKATQLVSELLQTFCPSKGHVLDTRAGAMTTGIACLISERPCTLLEKDETCFELAVKRLDELSRGYVEHVMSTSRQTRRTACEKRVAPVIKDFVGAMNDGGDDNLTFGEAIDEVENGESSGPPAEFHRDEEGR